ncbi:MAG TPA: hypothetical protein PKY82_08480 [Pyrinomonadaceae bacterium]|nr:hypothetical protein [Pyrinomonadaceae bacterium]
MLLITILFQSSNGMMFFGKIPETAAILLFAVGLIVGTIGIRRFLKRYDDKTNSEAKNKEVLR